ncbi:MAG: hypothetical protein WA708_01250 [Acidobacteriaceae bacterium]
MKRILLPLLLSATCSLGLTQNAPSVKPASWKDAGVRATAPESRPKGTALRACRDLTRPGTYYLLKDVSSEAGCFGIDADGIRLNLDGHTITYDTGGTPNSPAIEGHDCWSKNNPPITGPCGPSHGGAEIYNGEIVQAANASSFSPVFEFGQGRFSTAPYIHDITATFQNIGAQFYNSVYLPPGAKIENNTIYDNVIRINHPGQGDLSSRSAFQGQAITIRQNRNNKGAGDLVQENKIVGSPQGGVYSDNQHTVVAGNDISMNSVYTNDFCDAMAADYQSATANNCHPKSGRGFHTNADYNIISNNIIRVIELKNNAEYNGCEIDGSYGIQVEYDQGLHTAPVGVKVTGNTITANAGDCNAIGLRVSGMIPAANAIFTGNTVTTTNSGGAGKDFGISFDESNQGTTFEGNTFSDKYACADGEWDGFNGTIGKNTWLGSQTYTFVATDGGCDPSQRGKDAVCPSRVTFTDNLRNKVRCGPFSEATVTVGGKVTVCKAQQ